MNSIPRSELRRRAEDRIDAWRIAVEHVVETPGTILAFGQQDHQSVVLKVIRPDADEWRSGDVLTAFEGRGVVRVLDHADGAVLLERLMPGQSLVSLVVNGEDDRATGILADVIGRMSPRALASTCPTINDWARGFEWYAACGDDRIPKPLLEAARHMYVQLCATQSRPRLLHGDLHHDNVLRDSNRGWLAVDPKGVVGELEYEVGAALRNPCERPGLFTEPATIIRRVDRFARELHLSADRILGWAFAQAVLASIWAIEDGLLIWPDHPWMTLANNVRPMLKRSIDG